MLGNKIYYFHINKAGGTFVYDAIEEYNRFRLRNRMVHLPHESLLLDIPRTAPFFITFRDPFDRMCSSVYQLFRSYKKNPPKSVCELFKFFRSPEEFIGAVCNQGDANHKLALAMSQTYPHMSKSYWSFMVSQEFFRAESWRLIRAIEISSLDKGLRDLFHDIGFSYSGTNQNRTSKLDRKSGVDCYSALISKEDLEYYKEKIAPYEYMFYHEALKYSQRDERYHFVLKRYGFGNENG